MYSLTKSTVAEFIGTFALVFVGGAAVASGQPVIVPAIAHGFILAALIYAYGHISETHINPAVTAGLLVGGKITLTRAIAYWVAQFAGGIVAALILQAVIGSAGPTMGTLTDTNVWGAAVLEFIAVFLFLSTIYQVAVFGKGGNMAGFAIGVTLVAAITAIGTYTGASLNPARTLGPALIDGNLSYILPYFVGMFGGAIAAGLLHTYVLGPIKE